jgi:hypothetical protein
VQKNQYFKFQGGIIKMLNQSNAPPARNIVLALVCLICGLGLASISSALTGNLFYSMASTSSFGWAYFIAGIMLDCGKIVFPALAIIKIVEQKYGSVLVYGGMALVCLSISFFASQAFDLNQNNAIKNESIVSSAAFKRQGDLFDSTNGSISKLNDDIKKLNEEKSQRLEENKIKYDRLIANARKLHFITTPNVGVNALTQKQATQADKIIKDYDKKIGAKESLLNSKETSLKNINGGFGEISNTISTTKGVRALAAWLSPSDPDDMVGKLNMVKNIVLELASILFFVGFGVFSGREPTRSPNESGSGSLFQKVKNMVRSIPCFNVGTATASSNASSNYNVANRQNNTNVGYHDFEPYDDNEKVNQVQQSKKIGFDIPEVIIDKTPATQTETQYIDFNRDDILEYLEYMYENAEDDICPGERKFADNTELKNKQIRGIRYYLNKINVIKVLPGKCEILLPYSDALKLI